MRISPLSGLSVRSLVEAPMAHKSVEAIVDAIEPTAEIVDWLDVVHNLKAK